MKLKEIKKMHEGHYLTYYVAYFENKEGGTKAYEFTSRSKDVNINNFGKNLAAGVGLVPFSVDGNKILLQKEFRLATNQFIYNFPAGLIDEGEDAEIAAKRELKEETGLDLIEILDVLPISFASPGTSDEAMQVVICKADGELKDSEFVDEEIHAEWFSKEEAKALLNGNIKMSVRTQMVVWMWVNNRLFK